MKTALSLVLAFFSMALLISCEKDNWLFASTESKLEGEWRFEKVTFTPTFSFSCDDQTDEYAGYTLIFNADHTILRTTDNLGSTDQGSWDLDTETRFIDEDQSQVTEVLRAALVNTTTQQLEVFEWDDLSVTRKKIKANENRDGGYYRYKLVRK